MASPPYELVVYGATGYSGREAAVYLAPRAAQLGLRWALAGRNERALAEVAAGLPPPAPDILRADAGEPDSLAALAADAAAVISFVGPHAPLGDELLRRCIAAGTHYADLCGENDVIARRLAELDAPARAAGVKLIPACGYESVPFDLGVLGLDRALRDADGSRLREVEAEVRFVFHRNPLRYGHGNSGGTMTTIARLVEDDGLTDVYRFARELGYTSTSTRGQELELAATRSPSGEWLSPLIPTPFLNPAIIHLSSARLGEDEEGYSPELGYRETVNLSASLGSRTLGAIAAKGTSALLRRIAAMSLGRRRLSDRVTLALLRALAPGSGKGPRHSTLDALDYRIEMRARSSSGLAAEARIEGEGHPGYRSAANILAEAGIALVRDHSLPARGGVLTPASGLGLGFAESLGAAGLRFEFAAQP